MGFRTIVARDPLEAGSEGIGLDYYSRPFLFLSITNLLKRIFQERLKIGGNIFLLTVVADFFPL